MWVMKSLGSGEKKTTFPLIWFFLHFTPSLNFTFSLHFTPGLQSAVLSPRSAFYTDWMKNLEGDQVNQVNLKSQSGESAQGESRLADELCKVSSKAQSLCERGTEEHNRLF